MGEHEISAMLSHAPALSAQQALCPVQCILWPLHPGHVLAVDESEPLVGL